MNKTIRIISFDAFGTLYIPREPVPLQYHRIAKRFGVSKSEEEIAADFPSCYKYMTTKYPNYGKNCGKINSCDEWWLELIIRLFGIPNFKDNIKSKKICQSILSHFSSSEAYRIYDDVIPTLDYLQVKRQTGDLKVIISSNTDSGLVKVLQNLQIAKYFDSIYFSYDLGVSKPRPEFFNTIAEQEGIKYPKQILHIGDEWKKDYQAANNAGWNSIYLNRDAIPGTPCEDREVRDLREAIGKYI